MSSNNDDLCGGKPNNDCDIEIIDLCSDSSKVETNDITCSCCCKMVSELQSCCISNKWVCTNDRRVCGLCVQECSKCNNTFCNDHSNECERCNLVVCGGCISIDICKDCVSDLKRLRRSDDLSSVESSTFWEDKCREWIFAGVTIHYYDPISVTGDPNALRTAVVIRVVEDDEFPIVLDTGDPIPSWQKVKVTSKWRTLSRFNFNIGGNGGHADAIMNWAGRISDNHNRRVAMLTEGNAQSGIPVDMFRELGGGNRQLINPMPHGNNNHGNDDNSSVSSISLDGLNDHGYDNENDDNISTVSSVSLEDGLGGFDEVECIQDIEQQADFVDHQRVIHQSISATRADGGGKIGMSQEPSPEEVAACMSASRNGTSKVNDRRDDRRGKKRCRVDDIDYDHVIGINFPTIIVSPDGTAYVPEMVSHAV